MVTRCAAPTKTTIIARIFTAPRGTTRGHSSFQRFLPSNSGDILLHSSKDKLSAARCDVTDVVKVLAGSSTTSRRRFIFNETSFSLELRRAFVRLGFHSILT
ncbi:hypothetical protein VNO78_08160 [Psophocarpus tetragonolobus]|uniref:Uncharacterized protein n=1 Tax=Psophocarpus tetragonolobus TaxID=3891 RepID=A0AAN9T4L0_PSOTE